MPEISRFYGIVIGMFYDEHPPPHFHVRYGDHQAVVRIDDLVVVHGQLPARAFELVVEWATKHRAALTRNWNALEKAQPMSKIAPLK